MNDLDKRIAKEVMGWELATLGATQANPPGDGVLVTDGLNVFRFSPTTDANDVFGKGMLIDRMLELGYRFDLDIENNVKTIAVFISDEDAQKFIVKSDTQTLVAICLAAQEAINNE